MWKINTIQSSSKKIKIRYGIDGCDAKSAKDFLVIVTGRNEWIEKYHNLISGLELSESRCLLIIEHRGQGFSNGRKAFIKKYEDYLNDIKIVIDNEIGIRPYYILSHSMGSLISIRGIQSKILNPKSFVCLSPLLELPSRSLSPFLFMSITKIMTLLGFGFLRIPTDTHKNSKFENNTLTHDIKHYNNVMNSAVRQRFTTFGWLHATQKAIRQAFKTKNILNIKIPTLIISGTDERVVNLRGLNNWFKKVKDLNYNNIQLKMIDGARHELLSESEEYKNTALSLINNFFNKHTN